MCVCVFLCFGKRFVSGIETVHFVCICITEKLVITDYLILLYTTAKFKVLYDRGLFHFLKPHCARFETNTFDCDKPSLNKCK